MTFIVSCGCDLYGRKQNVKLEFPTCPTMTELINAVESQFDVVSRSARPAGYPDVPFKVQTFQVYDDILLRWVDLYSSAQLTNGCQVFCFQPESIWHSDSQGIIPEAKDNVTWTTPVGSPRRARIATDAGVAPALSEKLRSVFYDMDSGSKGYILYSDLRAAFARADMEFTYATVGEMFTVADSNRSGHITYDEWVRFSIQYPNVIDALFFRARDIAAQGGMQATYHTSQAESLQRARESQLRQYYVDNWQQPQPQIQGYSQPPMQGYQQPPQYASSPPMSAAGPGASPGHAHAEYEQAKRDADAARQQKEQAEARERAAWERMHYSPASPHFQ